MWKVRAFEARKTKPCGSPGKLVAIPFAFSYRNMGKLFLLLPSHGVHGGLPWHRNRRIKCELGRHQIQHGQYETAQTEAMCALVREH